jgi:hypothetical protein
MVAAGTLALRRRPRARHPHWFNEQRLHSALGHVPPVEYGASLPPSDPPGSSRRRDNQPLLNRGRFKLCWLAPDEQLGRLLRCRITN